METGTVRLQRVLRASPERVYRAFLDPAAMAKMAPAAWLHLHGRAHGRPRGWPLPHGIRAC